jgi:hypothetical protein
MQIQKWIALNRKKLYRFAFAPDRDPLSTHTDSPLLSHHRLTHDELQFVHDPKTANLDPSFGSTRTRVPCPRTKFLSLTQNLFQPRSLSTSVNLCKPPCSSPTKHTAPSPTSCRPSTLLKTHSHRHPIAPRGGFLQVVVSKATARIAPVCKSINKTAKLTEVFSISFLHIPLFRRIRLRRRSILRLKCLVFPVQ